MKKLVPLLLILFLYPRMGACQDLAQYEDIIKTTNDRGLKMAALDSLLIRTFSTNPKLFIQYSLQYIELAESMGNIEAAARKAMNLQRPLSNYSSNPTEAVNIIDNVLDKKDRIKDSLLLGGLYLKRGRAMAKINLERAIEDYGIALQNFAQHDTLNKADVYLFRGQAYSSMGKFVEASENLTQAYTLYEDKGEYAYMVYAQQGIINMFSMNGFFDKAKKERDMLIEKMKSLNLDTFLAGEYYNQAIDYKKMGKRELEYESLLKAEKLYDENPSNKSTFIGIHSMLIVYYCEDGDFDEAKKHLDFLEALEYNFSGDTPSEINYLGGKAEYLKAIGQFEAALHLAQKKLRLAEQLGIEDEIMATHNLLAEIYLLVKEPYKSIESTRAAVAIKDAIYNKSTANALVYYQTLYDIEKQGKKIIEKTTSIRLLEKDNEVFKKAILFGGIAILLFFGVVLLYRNQIHLKSHKLLQEKFSQELLVYQENERRRISKDLHDGIGQQLLVLKNRLMGDGDNVAKEMVDQTIEEVRGISRDLYPFQLQEMGITKAIEYTVDQIDENTSLFISTEMDNIDNVFSKDDEVNIYRIIQESLSNIVKHARAGAGKVSVKKHPDAIIISIKDNGQGFDFNDKYKDPKSLGLKTLLERTKVLKGQMKVTSKKDMGTLIEFQFPILAV
ncbi:hypothetical protein EI546_12595 [Aequorivita sp. H23M31]|uniref:histidine kinase n=1 Tax=Aequorivita ciconiae TaxID=2494375 RepID=A0A410G5N5_9FLAO|nr:ATP-binding protein [Aequorivita sp. H23M31]QAA82505.1 hypothetical protein EI546_12595 [Aequorivita sp. H23M31]